MSWEKTKVEDLCEDVYSGGTPKSSIDEYYGGDIPWLRTQEVTFNRIRDTEKTITEQGISNSSAKWVPSDSVIVAMYGASAGRVAINKVPLTTNQACCNLVADPEEVDYRFLYYSLCDASSSLGGLSKGAAQRNLNGGIIKGFEIRVPPLSEQQRIADILSAFDDLIEVNRQRIERLERAARLLYREWFVHHRFPGHEHTAIVDGVPEGWERVNLSKLVSTQYGYTESASEEPVGPQFLRGTDINKASYIDWDSVPYCETSESDYQKYKLKKRDVVVVRMADPGKCAIVEDEVDAVFASYLIRITPETEKITPYYLYFVLDDQHYQQHMSTTATGSTRKSASAGLLVDYDILIPPGAITEDFESEVIPMRRQIATLLRQNAKLRRARDILLPRLMSGEITV